MSTHTGPLVNDPSLQKKIDEAAKDVNTYTVNLNGFSKDILAVEKWLDSAGIRVVVSHQFYASGIIWDETTPDPYIGEAHTEHRSVAWMPSNEGKRWRLMYREVCDQGTMDVDGFTFVSSHETNLRPLIETSADIRLSAARAEALAALIAAVGKAVRVPRMDMPAVEHCGGNGW